MRRLRLEPPDEETVERIVEIARRIWRRQEQEELAEQEGVGVVPPPRALPHYPGCPPNRGKFAVHPETGWDRVWAGVAP